MDNANFHKLKKNRWTYNSFVVFWYLNYMFFVGKSKSEINFMFNIKLIKKINNNNLKPTNTFKIKDQKKLILF